MKVLHLESGLHLYGGAKQVLYIMQGLTQRGIENQLLCARGSAIGPTAESAGIETHYFKSRKGLGFSLYKEIQQTLQNQHPDLLHVHSRRLGADFWGGRAARKMGIPSIVSRRVDNPEARWIVALKYRPYRRVIAISEGIRRVLLAAGMPPDKVITVRSAINYKEISSTCDRTAFQAQFHLRDARLTIGVIAQLIERKGHRHLIRILPELLVSHPGLRVIFFGQGPKQSALQASVDNLGLSAYVTFAGFREDLLDWLGCLDLVVHPADKEGLGVSLVQAAAASRPIVATQAGGMPEIVRDHFNGLLVEPGNTTALLAAVHQLLSDPGMRQTMGHHGRQLVADEFSTEVMVEGNLACYRALLNLPSQPSTDP